MDTQQFFNLATKSFIEDTDKFMEFIQPFESFDDMINTATSWGILNKALPCKPKDQNIIGDGRRWIYVARCCSFFLEQVLYQKQGKFSESGKTYRLISISRPINCIFKNIWQIKYDSTLKHIAIEANYDFNSTPNSSDINARLLAVSKEAFNITREFIRYFKSISPSDVIKQWSLSYAMDTFDVPTRR